MSQSNLLKTGEGNSVEICRRHHRFVAMFYYNICSATLYKLMKAPLLCITSSNNQQSLKERGRHHAFDPWVPFRRCVPPVSFAP